MKIFVVSGHHTESKVFFAKWEAFRWASNLLVKEGAEQGFLQYFADCVVNQDQPHDNQEWFLELCREYNVSVTETELELPHWVIAEIIEKGYK